MCGYCDIVNMDTEMTPPSPFDENDFNRLSNEVWTGIVTTSNLPESIYLKTAQYLNEGIDNGVIGYEIPDELLIADLKENIYVFSGAKTYQQVRAMTAMLAEKEYASNFFAFKEAVKPMFSTYNVDWLQAEYQTSKASARMAAEWSRINIDKDVLGLLQYQTVGDARVRPTHQILDNIVKPVDDKFWDIYYPPNGWRCRCTVMQQSEGAVSDLTGWIPPDDVPPLFQMNAGKDRIVFKEKGKDKHPYFDVAKGDKENAKNNWGLPIPAKPKTTPNYGEAK